MNEYLQAVVTVTSLINPFICAAIFKELEAGRPPGSRVADATRVAVVVALILALSALLGAKVLSLFGVSLDAFQVAGGIVLAWMGFSMLRGADSHTKSHKPASGGESLAPLILFAASPGTITGVITIAITHSDGGIPVTALVGITVAVVMTWALMFIAARPGGKGGRSSLGRDISTRFMGLIVLAMGVQFALTGYQEFMSIG